MSRRAAAGQGGKAVATTTKSKAGALARADLAADFVLTESAAKALLAPFAAP